MQNTTKTHEQTVFASAHETLSEIASQRVRFQSILKSIAEANQTGVEMAVLEITSDFTDLFKRLDEQEARIRRTLAHTPRSSGPIARDATGGILCLGDRVRRCGSTDALGVARITALSEYKGQSVIEVRQGEAESLWYAHAVVRVP